MSQSSRTGSDSTRQEIAEMICLLNIWKTPEKIKENLNRELTTEEIRIAFAALESVVPKDEWLPAWKEGSWRK